MANFSVLCLLVGAVSAVNSVYVGVTPFGYTTTAHSFALPFVGGFRYGFPAAAPVATPFAATYAPGFPAVAKVGPGFPIAKIAPVPILPPTAKIAAAGLPFPFAPGSGIAALAGPVGPLAGPAVAFPGPFGPGFPGSPVPSPPIGPGILRR